MTAEQLSQPHTVPRFRHSATIAIENIRLQSALEGATSRFRTHREEALADYPQADQLRDHFKTIRSATLANLGQHLETFERSATAAGATVHWAETAEEAAQIVTNLALERGVSLVTKSKSMTTEEIHLNQKLQSAGIQAVETDLGEWIVQLAEETPSHIIAPAIHKTRSQVAELLSKESGQRLADDDIPTMTAEARRMLRKKFLAAGMGITGSNLGIAESGTIVLVTNEGNAEMVTNLPPIHVAIIGIEKIAPTWDDAATWLSLLARSATGQPLSIYTSFITGTARSGDPDGPQEMHIVLLDNKRSTLVGTTYEEALQCIRCGACLNVCPVYREAGGHAYKSPYSGPIGAVISPLLFGLEEYESLPQASSLCGACLDVCPARINLPRMLLELRTDEVEEKVMPWHERIMESSAAFVLAHNRLMRLSTAFLRFGQRFFMRNGRLTLPKPINPLPQRQLPHLAPKPFRDQWKEELEN
ncbi:MAG: LutB/LldF family L-lactate oxidation iron-sulfur protein [Candidatus Promineifilaceae bacterium]